MDFETLLSDRLAALITSNAESLDARLEDLQRLLCEALDADRSALWFVENALEGTRRLRLGHQVTLSDQPLLPASPGVEETCPWTAARSLAGHEVLIEDVDRLPPEAAQDRDALTGWCCRSLFALPLLDRGGAVFGVLAFGRLQTRAWTPTLLGRCRLAAQVICAVLLRERSEAAARREQQQLQKLWQVVEHVPASVVITDAWGDIEYVNPGFTQITGYSLDEVRGRNPRLLKSGHTTPEQYAELWQTLRSGQAWWGEFHNRRKDGSLFWERSLIAPVRDASGAIVNFIAVKEDLTAQKDTQAELTQVRHQLLQSQKVDALGQLAGGIAHDFNNLLTVIQSVGNDLVLQLGPDSPHAPDLHELLDASHRAVALTRQLLTYSRQQPHRPHVLDLVALVKDAEKLLRRVLREDIKLSIGLAVSELPVFADPSQLHQVLVNLAVNARDAMPRGGELFVEVSERELTRGEGPPQRHATLTVRDTGAGIPPELRRRVFEPFFTTKEPGKGTGLGLSTVQSIVTQSGGQVALDSEVGVGTTVRVHFPRAVGTEPRASAERSLEAPRGSERLLIIEDDAMVRGVIMRTLSRCGYEVLAAPDGSAGLALLAAEGGRIDLVLTDVVMPRMSGLDVARAVRARQPAMPVLFTSGFNDLDEKELEALSGAPVISKPSLPHELSVAVRAALDRARR